MKLKMFKKRKRKNNKIYELVCLNNLFSFIFRQMLQNI